MSSTTTTASTSTTSLTPASRNQEATETAMHQGLISGAMTLVPTMGAVYLAMKNSPTFLKRTNMQSRTAITIMPALFAFAWTAEHSLQNKMHEIAHESQHNDETVKWAEQELQKQSVTLNRSTTKLQRELEEHKQLSAMYRQSVVESGVCIVPGDTLSLHHQAANYVSAHPIKVLASLAVPSVAYIFYGNNNKATLDFGKAILHTRVFGQFATLSLLLGVMGFKEYMDQNVGRFVTETEAQARVNEMHQVRRDLLQRLEAEKQHQLEQQQEIAKAHEEDVREHNVHVRHVHKKKNKKQKKHEERPQEADNDVVVPLSH